jgi:hypothetical protein
LIIEKVFKALSNALNNSPAPSQGQIDRSNAVQPRHVIASSQLRLNKRNFSAEWLVCED